MSSPNPLATVLVRSSRAHAGRHGVWIVLVALVLLAASPQASGGEPRSPIAAPFQNEERVLIGCSGCGCRGGPGWRIKSTGKCASHKGLAKQCGSPPSPSRCTKEN